jgi:hypothetical protein
MGEKTNTSLSILGIIIISFIIGFIFGSAYREGNMKKIIKYCVERYTDKNEILYCIQEALDEEKEDTESYR